MSAVTVKKPYGCGEKGPPELLSPAAAPLSCQDAVEGMFIVHIIEYNFLLICCSTTALRGSSSMPITELAFFPSLSWRLQFLSVVQLPQQSTA